ncbi:hypothetical protein SAZ11_08000 [Streptomyces sp. FXJ1.4098]|nr:hypothetical protein [Streptomyces sp. FXJ1.4098]
MPGTRAVGFTATLARGDSQGLGGVWEDTVYTRSPLWMMSRGHLVDVKSKLIDVDTLHLGDVKKSRGDYTASSLEPSCLPQGPIAARSRSTASPAPDTQERAAPSPTGPTRPKTLTITLRSSL